MGAWLLSFVFLPGAAWASVDLKTLHLPDGFKIEVYADVPDARELALGPDGIVFVGTRAKSVYALKPQAHGKAEVIRIADGLNAPNGVAFRNDDLYVAEINRVLRYKNIVQHLKAPPKPVAFGPGFPNERHHGFKFIAFGPDGWLYVPVGAPCNICARDLNMFAALHRISPDGSKRELVAQGVRNTVGFDWDPATRELWFTDNGRDWMGDERPPCELNHLTQFGENFGYPYCHGGDILDPEFGKGKNCADYVAPAYNFPAHTAPLGMRFIRNNKRLKGSILVASHGSWNRSVPTGYKVIRLEMKDGKVQKASDFLSGFLVKSHISGRPVDVLELADGSILVSDDDNGKVYRID